MSSRADRLTMNQLGEKAFLEGMLPELNTDPHLIDGHGNDATALRLDNPTTRIAFKIDRAARPVSLSHGWSDHRAWGRMAVTANCSDILAAGAKPFAFMVAITVPGTYPARDVKEIIAGCQEVCERHGVAFAGGDTKEGPHPQVVGSAVGIYSEAARPLARNTAKAGDLFLISGPVGGFLGAALQLTRRPDAPKEQRQEWIRYLAYPEARWQEATQISRAAAPTAAVDTSDGIFDGILELTDNRLGLRLNLDKVVFHPFALQASKEFDIPIENFLFGAGDWNILYAFDPKHRMPPSSDNSVITAIGHFTAEPDLIAVRDSAEYDLSGPRNEHFRSRLEDGKSFFEDVAKGTWLSPRN